MATIFPYDSSSSSIPSDLPDLTNPEIERIMRIAHEILEHIKALTLSNNADAGSLERFRNDLFLEGPGLTPGGWCGRTKEGLVLEIKRGFFSLRTPLGAWCSGRVAHTYTEGVTEEGKKLIKLAKKVDLILEKLKGPLGLEKLPIGTANEDWEEHAPFYRITKWKDLSFPPPILPEGVAEANTGYNSLAQIDRINSLWNLLKTT